MATLLQTWGTNNLNPSNYRGNASGSISVYLESQSTVNNTSYIRIDHYLKPSILLVGHGDYMNCSATSSYRTNYGTYASKTKNLTDYMSGDPTSFFMGSSYHTVSHAADGTCTLYVDGSIALRLILRNEVHALVFDISGTKTSSFSKALPTIPRYAVITAFNTSDVTMTSFKFNVSADRTIDSIQHSFNGGGWTDSGNQIISGLSPGTQYSIRCRVKSTASQLWTESGILYPTTTNYAVLASVPNNIIIGTAVSLTYNNPSGAATTVALYKADFSTVLASYRECTGGSYTFNFTEEELNNIYETIPATDNIVLRFFISTNYGENTYLSYVDRTFVLTNANPTFTNFTYQDINTTTTALTGNNQTIIKGYSSLRGIITTANKMVAIKGATPSRYELAVSGSTTKSGNYSASATVNLDIGVVSSNVFTVNAIDSRGNAKPVIKNATTYREYFNVKKGLAADNTVARTGSVSKTTTLKLKGEFWNSSFGSVANTFVEQKYRYKETDSSTWSEYKNITLTKSGNVFTYNASIQGNEGALGFSIDKSYNIQVLITDKLSSITYDLILATGQPNIAIHKDGVAFKGLYDTSVGGALQVNGPAYFNTKLFATLPKLDFQNSPFSFNVVVLLTLPVLATVLSAANPFFTLKYSL